MVTRVLVNQQTPGGEVTGTSEIATLKLVPSSSSHAHLHIVGLCIHGEPQYVLLTDRIAD